MQQAPADPTDDEVLTSQAALQAAATVVLEDLDLLARIRAFGVPAQTGSSAYGLMVARDIDVTTLCPTLDIGPVFALGAELATHPRVERLTFRNATGAWNTEPDYPDGLYWLIDYVANSGEAWTLDCWFLREGTTQYDLEDLDSLPPRLTTETRLAILRIKAAWQDRPADERVRSYRIYAAVLDGGIRTPDEFAAYLEPAPD